MGGAGFAGLMAPEAAPWEIDAAEAGVGLIEAGGRFNTIGSALTGYSNGGGWGAVKAAFSTVAFDRLMKGVAGLALTGAQKTAFGAFEAEITEALAEEEEFCSDSD